MLTRLSFILCLWIMTIIPAVSQIRHVKKVKSIEALYGISQFGTSYQLGYIYFFHDKLYGKANLLYEKTEKKGLTSISTGGQLAVCYTFIGPASAISLGESFYLNAKGGVSLTVDKL